MAKRNKAKARAMRSGKSPYARHGKSETIYSASYYVWFQANHQRGQRHRLDLGRSGGGQQRMAA